MTRPDLSPLGTLVRRADPDRFFCSLFAPPDRRDTLWTLYAFNHELARAREAAREPMAALIRLQWWRDVLDGKRLRHEVATPLGQALDDGRLLAADLHPMVDAREMETEPMATMAEFDAYVDGTAGSLTVAAGWALGMPEAERLRRAGGAFGLAGVLTAVPALARQGRCLLPEDLLHRHGLTPAGVIARPDDPALLPVRAALAALATDRLRDLPPVPRPALAAVLPLVLARRRLRGAARPLGDRLAVLRAAVRGRV